MEKPKSSVEKGRKSRLRNYGAFLVPSTCLSHFFPRDGGRLSQISPGKHVTHSGEGRNLSYTGNKIYEAKKKIVNKMTGSSPHLKDGGKDQVVREKKKIDVRETD